MVGARGLIQTRDMRDALEFLQVPHGKWQSVINSMVQASSAALALMNNMRFAAQTTGPIPSSLSSKVDSHALDLVGKRKRKSQDVHGDLGAVMTRWKKMTARRQ